MYFNPILISYAAIGMQRSYQQSGTIPSGHISRSSVLLVDISHILEFEVAGIDIELRHPSVDTASNLASLGPPRNIVAAGLLLILHVDFPRVVLLLVWR
jgi:hypothetical protein